MTTAVAFLATSDAGDPLLAVRRGGGAVVKVVAHGDPDRRDVHDDLIDVIGGRVFYNVGRPRGSDGAVIVAAGSGQARAPAARSFGGGRASYFFAAAAACACFIAAVCGMPGTERCSPNAASKLRAISSAVMPPSLYRAASGFGVWKSV